MSVAGPKLGSTLLTVPKREWNQSCEDSLSSSSGSEREPENIGFPGLQVQNLKNALERGTVTHTYDHLMRPDLQQFYQKLKVANETSMKKKSSFSIDSLAKSAREDPPQFTSGCVTSGPINGFTNQHQELYRKALENLNETRQKIQNSTNNGLSHLNPMLGMGHNGPNLGPAHPAHQFLAHQAHLARIQHQQRQHSIKARSMHPQSPINSPNVAARRISLSASIVREAKNQLKGLDPENMYIECPLCHKRIKRLYHFQRHMRIHSGEKSHQCPYCPYRSVRKDNLKSHLKTHEKHAMEARRNAALLDKKRKEEIVAMRRLQQFSIGHLTGVGQMCPTVPQMCPNMKEEAIIKEIDSGCESPQEDMLSKRGSTASDTSGIESGQSDRHSSKESDSTFTHSSPESMHMH